MKKLTMNRDQKTSILLWNAKYINTTINGMEQVKAKPVIPDEIELKIASKKRRKSMITLPPLSLMYSMKLRLNIILRDYSLLQ